MSAEKDFFLENFSLLERAGMPVSEALLSLKEEVKTKEIKKVIAVLEDELASGSSLTSALEKSKLLGKRYLSLLRIGEETGQFSKQLSLVIEERKKEKIFSGKIRSALMYPGFVLIVTFIVGVTVLGYVFPKLISVFQEGGATLPLTTRIIIAIGTFFQNYGVVAVPLGLLTLALLVYFLFINRGTRVYGEWLLIHTPVAKSIIEEIELTRFGYMLGTLVNAGITLPQALESLQESTSFVLYKKFYAAIGANVQEGNSLYKSITLFPGYQKYIPSHIVRLMLAGERSGSLPETLVRVSEEYDQKLDSLTQNASALLEPIIIVVVGLIVAIIALGVISPIYGLVNTIN